MNEKRRYVRHRDALQMSVKLPTGDAKTYVTRDVSNGGLFLLAKANEQLPVGTEVIITPVKNVAVISTPSIKGRVVRSSAQGIGVEFLDPKIS